jgi:heptosyltransferase-3
MRLLISRIDAIGDVCLTLPAVGWLKENHPQYHVSFLVQDYAAPIAKACSWIDQVVILDKSSLENTVNQLKSIDADQIIHISPNKSIAKAAKLAKIRLRTGVLGRIYNWFYCNRLIRLSRSGSGLHESYLNLLAITRSLGMADPELNDFKQHIVHYAGLNSLKNPSLDKSKQIILHPFSRGSGREWPISNFLELAKLLVQSGLTPVMAGIKSDFEQIKAHVAEFPPQTIWAMGEGDLNQYIHRIGESAGLVASGTGPLHIASLINIPSIGLFPPRQDIDPTRWGTINPLGISLVSQKACSKKCSNKDCACMANISAQEVLSDIKNLISQQGLSI